MYDGCAAYHVRRFPRPSPSVFAYWKRSKAGGVEGLGTRLETEWDVSSVRGSQRVWGTLFLVYTRELPPRGPGSIYVLP